MLIVLDTNVFYRDFYLTKPQTSVMLDNLNLIKSIVCVPQVVFDEVINKYSEEVCSRLETINKMLSELDETLGISEPVVLDANDSKHYSSLYSSALVKLFRKYSIKQLPYPNVTHHTVVQRDLARRLPFKQSGKGYRDCLIWETIKEALVNTNLAIMGHNEVAFITENFSDFGDNDGIAVDLKGELHDRHSVTLFRSVKDFNDSFISPKLASVKSIDGKLQDVGLNRHPLPLWLHNNLKSVLSKSAKKQIILDRLGLPIDARSVSVDKVGNINNFNINQAVSLSSGELFMSVSFESDIKARLDITTIDYHQYDSVKSYLGSKFYGLFCQRYELFSLAISMSIVLTVNPSGIKTHEIDTIKVLRMPQVI